MNELYGHVFSLNYGFHSIGLRYFNVFGPKQNPNGPYAAVIPLFISMISSNKQPIINGDGSNSRDFTYVSNVIQANIKAMLHPLFEKHEVMNVACGDQISLNEMAEMLTVMSNKEIIKLYGPERTGDVRHSKASISKIQSSLNYYPTIKFNDGLRIVYNWYVNQSINK